jgi:hypothetical protein
MKGNHLTCLGVHGDPDPLLVRFLLDEAGHLIGFHLQTSDHDVAMAGDRLDVEMIRQGLEALDEKAQQPLEGDAYRATNAAQGNAFHK